ncbi:hypothetical protein GCM10010276_82560 [Streptomyces longisporus]|uniref:Uncharacterized protein n=1 Tax=Streptomyces longisporus TaxID=1948 RepID=A0ABN3NII7_STRLO
MTASDTAAGLPLDAPAARVARSDRRVHLWHLLSGRMAELPNPHHGQALAVTGDGHLVTAGRNGVHSTRLGLAALWASPSADHPAGPQSRAG